MNLSETKDFQLIGKLIEKNPVVMKGSFASREFVIEKEVNYNGKTFYNYIKFQCVQDRTNIIDPVDVGDTIQVSFNIKGNKWMKDGKNLYFTNLDAWRIQKAEETNGDEPPMPEYQEPFSSSSSAPEQADDLPF